MNILKLGPNIINEKNRITLRYFQIQQIRKSSESRSTKRKNSIRNCDLKRTNKERKNLNGLKREKKIQKLSCICLKMTPYFLK